MPLSSPRFARDSRLQQAAENNPTMKHGERGEPVAIVQRALVDLGYPMPITTANGTKLADGIFGDETARVVRDFQRQQGLSADGIVGHDTLAALEQAISAKIAADRAGFVATSNLPGSFANSGHRTLRA